MASDSVLGTDPNLPIPGPESEKGGFEVEDYDLSRVVAPGGLGWKDNNCEEKVCEADGKNERSGDLGEREHRLQIIIKGKITQENGRIIWEAFDSHG